MAQLLRGGSEALDANGQRRVETWFSTEPTQALAMADVGLALGDGAADNGSLIARGFTAREIGPGAGFEVDVAYDTNPPGAGSLEPFSPVSDPEVYSWSIGYQTVERDVPSVRTVEVLAGTQTEPTSATRWTEPEMRRVRTTTTRITLSTGATSAQLGFTGADPNADYGLFAGLNQHVNKLMVVGSNQCLFRPASINQTTRGPGGDFSQARWSVVYEWIYDPGARSETGSATLLSDRNALAFWAQGNGSGDNDAGYLLPHVQSPYTDGPSGRFQIPPFCETIVIPAPATEATPIRDRAPAFEARPLYDTTTLTLNALPGVST